MARNIKIHPRVKPRLSMEEARRKALFAKIDRIKFNRGLWSIVEYQIKPNLPK